MKSTAIAFFVFFVCMLLGFTVARSDLLNPITADVNAEAVRMQIRTENQLRLESLELDRQREEAQREANLYLTKALASTLYLLSAVVAGCILVLTAAAVYWMLRRAQRPRRETAYAPPTRRQTPSRPDAAAPGKPHTLRSEPILQQGEHI
jgi:hypothetical protein